MPTTAASSLKNVGAKASNIISKLGKKLHSFDDDVVDVYGTVSYDDGQDEEDVVIFLDSYQTHDLEKDVTLQWHEKLWNVLTSDAFTMFTFLSVLGCLCSITAFFIDVVIDGVFQFVSRYILRAPIFLGYLLWIFFSVTCVLLGAAVTQNIHPEAAGSGIPEMKAILSGVVFQKYLSIHSLVAKIVGLILAFAGGLSIGREGPYVHISCIIANLMTKVPIWPRIARNDSLRLQILAAACAVGVSTSFGTPIGGVLFSVEVTATYYLVENLWKAYFCSLCGTIITILLKLATQKGTISLFQGIDLSFGNIFPYEYAAFVFIGIVGGLLGAAFTSIFSMMVEKVKTLPYPILREPTGIYIKAMATALVVSIVTYVWAETQNDQRTVIQNSILKANSLFNYQSLSFSEYARSASPLILLFILKAGLTMISTGFCSIPCGIYTPLFLLGAIFGRFTGETLFFFLPSHDVNKLSGYAIVGAAALCAGATHTISSAVIVLELAGSLDLLLPILIAVLLADGVGKLSNFSIYDVMLVQKGLPYLPGFRAGARTSAKTAFEILDHDNVWFVSLEDDARDVMDVLSRSDLLAIPLVQDRETMLFLGSVKRNELQAYVTRVLSKDRGRSEDDVGTGAREESKEGMELMVRASQDGGTGEGGLTGEGGGGGGTTTRRTRTRTLIPFVFTTSLRVESSDPVVVVDPTALQISDRTHLQKIHFIFTMLGMSCCFVTNRGRLLGTLTKRELLKHVC